MTTVWTSRWTHVAVRALLTAAVGVVAAAPLLAAGQTASAEPQVTFTKDIAPILQRSCQKCHRPDSLAPMSLLTYEDARPCARAIKARTGRVGKSDVMPPWYIEKDIGIQQYKGDISLSGEEIAKMATWADSGAPRGNPADMPPAGSRSLTQRSGRSENLTSSSRHPQSRSARRLRTGGAPSGRPLPG